MISEGINDQNENSADTSPVLVGRELDNEVQSITYSYTPKSDEYFDYIPLKRKTFNIDNI